MQRQGQGVGRKRLGKAVAGPGPLEIKSGVCGLETVGLEGGRLEPRSPLAHSVVAAGPVRQGASLGSSALVGLRLPRWCSDHEEGHRGQL